MYKLRPLVSHDDLPAPSHDMYRMKPLQIVTEGVATVRLTDLSGRVQELVQESKGDMTILEVRQEDILKKLSKLKTDIEELRAILRQPTQVTPPSYTAATASSATCSPCPELGGNRDLVVYASPEHPPYSILGLARLWAASCPLQLSSHTHSSVKAAPAEARYFTVSTTRDPCYNVTVVWKNVGAETELVINPIRFTTICGETNILRFLSRVGPSNFNYESSPNLTKVSQIDEVLDNCQRLARSKTAKEKQAIIRSFNASLGKSEWMCGLPQLSIVDVAVWSVLKQLGSAAALTPALTKWMEHCDSMLL